MDTNQEIWTQVFDCMCRACMHELVETEQQWHSIFDTIEKCGSLHIYELLVSAVPQIEMKQQDELPKKICCKCLEQLQNIYSFQQMCVQSDKQIHELIANRNFDQKMKITRETVGKKICTQPSSLKGKTEEIENYRVNTFPEVSQTVAADPLQSNDIGEYVKEEPSDNDERNNSDGESLHTIKNELVTIDTDEEPESMSPLTHICSLCNESFKKLCHLQRHLKSHEKDNERSDMTKRHEKNNEQSDMTKRHEKHNEQSDMTKSQEKNNEQSDMTKRHTKFQRCRFKCDVCNRYFHKAESLYKHRLAHDGKGQIPKYPCEQCETVLSSKQSLTKHKQYKHSEKSRKPKKYICEICDRALVNSSALKCHLATHSKDRPFLCPECGKAFAQQGNLRQHRLRHLDTEAFECPHCPKKFRTKGYLSKHILIHKDNKKHVCDICGYGFIKAHQLTTHKRYHNGIKPHKCDCCEMRFVTHYAKRRHMRIHTGEKPYKCKYCERAYAQSNDHIKHLRSHIGDNVYRCEFCPSAFRLASELRAHFASHKNDDEEIRAQNMQALKEADEKLKLKLMKKKRQ